MTIALALSLALATASLLLQFLNHLRDRPNLSVRADTPIAGFSGPDVYMRDDLSVRADEPNAGASSPHVLRVEVVNRGKRPTTIMEVGLEVCGHIWHVKIDDLRLSNLAGRPLLPVIRLHEDALRLLEPGEVRTYKWAPAAALFSIDEPLRPYVIDSHGHQTWGHARSSLRDLVNQGWKPVTVVALPPSSPLPHTIPVAPIWHVWKPREQRGSWRHPSDYRAQRWRRTAMPAIFTPTGLSAAVDRARAERRL